MNGTPSPDVVVVVVVVVVDDDEDAANNERMLLCEVEVVDVDLRGDAIVAIVEVVDVAAFDRGEASATVVAF